MPKAPGSRSETGGYWPSASRGGIPPYQVWGFGGEAPEKIFGILSCFMGAFIVLKSKVWRQK